MKKTIFLMAVFTVFCVAADTEVVDGIEWTYTVIDGEASIGAAPDIGWNDDRRAIPAGTTGDITIPSVLGGYPVTSIGAFALANCGLSSVVIPSSVKVIGDYAFGYNDLTRLVFHEGVEQIGDGIWQANELGNLHIIVLPRSLRSIGCLWGDITSHIDFYFLGDAPELFTPNDRDHDYTIHYRRGSSGWPKGEVAIATSSWRYNKFEVYDELPAEFYGVYVDTIVLRHQGKFYEESFRTLDGWAWPEAAMSLSAQGPWLNDPPQCASPGVTTVWRKYLDSDDIECISNMTVTVVKQPELRIDSVKRNDPWDGTLAIDYTINGDVNALDENNSSILKIVAFDVITGTTYTADGEYLQGDISVASGSHHLEWRISDQTGVLEDSALWVTASCEGLRFVVDGIASRGSIAVATGRGDVYRTYEDETCRLQYSIAPGGSSSIESVEYIGGETIDASQVSGLKVIAISAGAFAGVPKNVKVLFKYDAPAGLAESGLVSEQIIYLGRYASSYRPNVRIISSKMRESEPTILDVVYCADCALPNVKVRALAFEDGERSFAKVVRPEAFIEGTDANIGDAIAANAEHAISWQVSSDWQVKLAKVKFEVLANNGELFPIKASIIPAGEKYGRIRFMRNQLTEEQVYDALLWLYASGDADLKCTNGNLWSESLSACLVEGAKLNQVAYAYVLSKAGWSELSGDLLDYINRELRLNLPDFGCGYKFLE